MFADAEPGNELGRWDFSFPHISGTMVYDALARSAEASITVAGRKRSYRLDVGSGALRYGKRRFWLCEACAGCCETVVVTDAQVLCRVCYKKLPGHYSQAHRSALLIEADEAHRSGDSVVTLRLVFSDPGSAEKLDLHAVQPSKAKPSSRSVARGYNRTSLGMLTTTAIDRGRGLIQTAILDALLRMDAEDRSALPLALGYFRPATSAFIGNAPELNIHTLRVRFAGAPGRLVGNAFRWGNDDAAERVAIFVDRRECETLIVVAHDWRNAEAPRWQRLPLLKQPDGRVRFICPVREKPCDILYLRDGLFASREAQRLIYPSQRGVKRKRKEALG